MIGVNRRVLSQLERGKTTVQLQIALDAAQAVGLDIHLTSAAMSSLVAYLGGDRAGQLLLKQNGNMQLTTRLAMGIDGARTIDEVDGKAWTKLATQVGLGDRFQRAVRHDLAQRADAAALTQEASR